MNANPPISPHQLLDALTALGIDATTTSHVAVHTVEESRALRGECPGLHSKNLFLKDKKDRLWLVVAQEDRVVDLKRLRKRLGAATLSFGKADLLFAVLGVAPGSVTPFAVINDRDAQVRVVLDKVLAEGERVNFHPLTNTQTTAVCGPDLLRFLRHYSHDPLIIDFESQPQNA